MPVSFIGVLQCLARRTCRVTKAPRRWPFPMTLMAVAAHSVQLPSVQDQVAFS